MPVISRITLSHNDALALKARAPNTGLHPTVYTRREQWYLAGVSPFVGWRTWRATGGG